MQPRAICDKKFSSCISMSEHVNNYELHYTIIFVTTYSA